MKILIIKLGALGDIIMSTPIIKQIQAHHAEVEIFLLTAPAYKELFNEWHGLNVIAIPRKGIYNLIKTVWWIQKNKFDRIYDLQSNDRTSILCALSGVPFRAGNHPRFPYTHHPATKYTGQCHAFDRLKDIIASAGIEPGDDLPEIPINESVREKIDAWLYDNKLTDQPFILLHAGANIRHPQKRWPFFSELASRLVDRGFKIIWLGAEDDRDLNKTLSKQIGINATNLFNIPELIALGEKSCFAVTNDSAPMHILSCSGIPVYGLFGPTDWTRTHALGQKEHVIAAAQLTKNKKSCGLSIETIAVNVVLEKLFNDELLTT